VAQRFFEHDADIGSVQARLAQLRAHHGEQMRAGRQVHHRRVGPALVEPGLQRGVVLGPRQIHAAIEQQRRETRELLVVGALRALHLGEPFLDECAIGVVAAFIARHGQDAPVARQLAMAKSLEQRRHQLAPCQVTGSAEEHEIERHRCRTRQRNFVSRIIQVWFHVRQGRDRPRPMPPRP
jgi:hypothetical protein